MRVPMVATECPMVATAFFFASESIYRIWTTD
eukprot:SAG11_NODE_31874_length_288_cov_0.978836_1_plen_31_part_10